MTDTNRERKIQIAALFSQTIAAHKEYERDVLNDQYDVEWPKWYAHYLLEHDLLVLLGNDGNDAQLDRPLDELLIEADASHRANAPDERWEDYYARYLIEIAERP